jgi:hypothetical protein
MTTINLHEPIRKLLLDSITNELSFHLFINAIQYQTNIAVNLGHMQLMVTHQLLDNHTSTKSLTIKEKQ